mmetsp:Transcript_33910/g.75493  ORF Transcript_33910/g.75493 Transcript_33910/m.75493 type:complete len:970 (-) Transcript_33910:132-3041(-)
MTASSSPRAKSRSPKGPDKTTDLLSVPSTQRLHDRAGLEELRSELRSVALSVAKVLASIEEVKNFCRQTSGHLPATVIQPAAHSLNNGESSLNPGGTSPVGPVLRQQRTSTSNSELSFDSAGTWPDTVRLREELTDLKISPSLSKSSKDMGLLCKKSQSALSEFDDEKLAGGLDRSVCCCEAMRPSSPFYISFQLMSLIVLLWDAITIPFSLAWSLNSTDLLNAGGWFSTVFWTTDVCMSFLVGFYHDGEVILSFTSIAANYFRGWFLLDIILVLIDWMSVGLGDESGKTVKLFRILKLARFLRILSILRLARLWRVVEEMLINLLSENNRVLIQITWMCSMVLLLNHMVACMWFAVGVNAVSDTHLRWTDLDWQQGDAGGSARLLDMSLEFQYTTAFHWAIAQITLGANEINSTNTSERIMQIACLLLGLVCGSTFISSLSAAIFEYHAARQDRKRIIRTLRRFLRQHNVNSRTAFAVQRMVNARISKAEVVHEEDVSALQLLRPDMRAELNFVIHKSSVLSYPLFSVWVRMDMKSVWSLTASGTTLHMLPDEELFESGRPAESLYFFIRGIMLYTQEMERVIEDLSHETRVDEESWLCEAGLWTHWQHVGSADCLAMSEVWEIKVEAVLKTLEQHHIVQQLTLDYARQMHIRIRTARPPVHSYPSDLHVPCGDFHEILFTLSKESRVAYSTLAINQFSEVDIYGMRHDAFAGKVLLVQHGEMLASMSAVISCKIYTDDSRQKYLMELARSISNGRFDIAPRFPQYEREFGETGDERLERALSNELLVFKPLVTWTNCRRRSEVSESKGDLCMLTLRTVYEGVCESEDELPALTVEVDDTEQQVLQQQPSVPHQPTTWGRSATTTFPIKFFHSSRGRDRVLLDEEMRVYMHTSYELNESSPSGSGSRCVILYTALSQQQADAINSEKHLQKLLEDKLDELQVFHSIFSPNEEDNGRGLTFEESDCMEV